MSSLESSSRVTNCCGSGKYAALAQGEEHNPGTIGVIGSNPIGSFKKGDLWQ